jgi:hypothetical protein
MDLSRFSRVLCISTAIREGGSGGKQGLEIREPAPSEATRLCDDFTAEER